MKKKGLHCCGFRYQHTYNGKLTEGRGNFVCISTILDLYFLWEWIGRLSRGTNHIYIWLDPWEYRPISRIFSHRKPIFYTRVNPGFTLGFRLRLEVGTIFSKLQTVHMVGLQGEKTHVMVLWCATDTCDDIAEYFYTCAMNINRWKCSRAAFVGFHTCDPAAKRSTSRAWCHDSTFGSRLIRGDRCLAHQWAREVTNSVRDLPRPTRGWESVSSN